ncbi:hypothetical protein [Streptodolium elevatio]
MRARLRPGRHNCRDAVLLPAEGPWGKRLHRHQGEDSTLPGGGRVVVATTHPSAVLRAPDRDAVFAGLVDDLRVVCALAG